MTDPDTETRERVDDYRPPEDFLSPLTGDGPRLSVKRLNRRTIGLLAGAVAVVACLAFGTSLTRKPAFQPNAATRQDAPPTPLPGDAYNTLPGTYEALQAANRWPGVRVGEAIPTGLTPGPVQYVPGAYSAGVPEDEDDKRAARAREAGFGFAGGGSSQGAGTQSPNGLEQWSGAGSPASLPNPGMPTIDRDADNRQDDKRAFLEKTSNARWELTDRLHALKSPYTIFAGSVIPGVLITGINSDLPGEIEGQISENVYDTVSGRFLILPQGTKIIGAYDSRISYGQSRVLVVWTRLIRPDGSSLDLEGMPGVDLSGFAGLTGRVDRHLSRLLGAVVLGSLIQAGTSAGSNYTDPSFGDRVRQGAGQGVNEATQQIVRKELQLQPTIVVVPGSRFTVFTTKDIAIQPT